MQFRIYDRQTLAYKDGGYVASYTIDDDYIVNNNSTINIIKELNDKVVVGDTIVLIKTSGAYHKGTITTFDNADFKITYKADKELFNDNMLNPSASFFANESNKEATVSYRFGIDVVAGLLESYFGKPNDWLRQLPIKVITDGDVVDDNGNVKMLWTWKNDTINVVDWLVELFQSYNLSLSWSIDFNIAETDLSKRKPYYIVTLSSVVNGGKIIKDNVEMQTITYTEKKLPEATVCVVLDNKSKEIYKISSNTNLFNPYNITQNKNLTISEYGYEQTTNDDTSSISGYIGVKVTLEDNYKEVINEQIVEDSTKKGTYYTYSCKGYTNQTRYIACYDKEKKLLYYVTYNFGYRENDIIAQPLFLQDKNIKYIRICFANRSTELQLEKGYKIAEDIKYDGFNIPAIYYLCEKSGNYYVSLNSNEKYNGLSTRVMPSKMITAIFDTSSDNSEETTPQEVAENTLIPSKFNQAIEIQISADSKMFDFENSHFGDLYKIINEHGTIDSNYTGRKEDSSNKWINLYFGLGRQNYTDLIQMRMRKNKYQVVYTK